MSSGRFAQLAVGPRAYVVTVVTIGAVTVSWSAYDLAVQHTPWSWTILAVLTLISGSATIKLPALPATITVSETFVFSSVLLFGPSAGTITVALDALVISFWSYRKGQPFHKIVFNLFALPLTIWLASELFFYQSNIAPLFHTGLDGQPFAINTLLFPLAVLALTYFTLNSWIITFAISLEKGLSPYRIWRDHFAWLSLNYLSGASVAALLVSYTRNLDYTYLALILPLIVVLYVTFSTSMGRVADANKHISDLNHLYMSTIETLAMAVDAKDQITHGHIRRVQAYAVRLAQRLGVIDPLLIRAIEAASLLHDMGKLAVPEHILNKPGPLTAAEFRKMQLHAAVGADMLAAIEFPYPVVPIVRHHHENWDGTGYPDGLAGSDIPVGARVLSVVDCFDALTSDRPYRPKMSAVEALAILSARRGSMYDPVVVDAFVASYPSIASDHSEVLVNVAPPTVVPSISTDQVLQVAHHQKIPKPEGASCSSVLNLLDLVREFGSHLHFSDAGDIIAKYIRRLIPFSLCVCYVYDVDADQLAVGHSVGDGTDVVCALRITVGEQLSGWVAAHRQTIRNSDPALDFAELRGFDVSLKSCLSTPLIVDQSLFGVVSLYSQDYHAFNQDDQSVLEVIAGHIARTLSVAAAFDASAASATQDPRTGLPNAERLRELLDAPTWSGSLRYPLRSILLRLHSPERDLRVDSDTLFQDLAEIAISAVRSSDLVFSDGSDELIILLLNTDAEASQAIAFRLQCLSQKLTQTSKLSAASVFVTIRLSSSLATPLSVQEFLSSEADAAAEGGRSDVSIT